MASRIVARVARLVKGKISEETYKELKSEYEEEIRAIDEQMKRT